MIHNQTIDTQINHRSIRAFKDQTLTTEQLTTLYEAARHTSTSNFFQQFSIIHLTDPELRRQIRSISTQPYVGANGDLFIFIADLYRNQQIASNREMMMDVFTLMRYFNKQQKMQHLLCRTCW